jgi:hypothetical protein
MARSTAVVILVILAAALLAAPIVVAEGCVDATSCKSCVAGGCGWCASTLKCTPGWIPGFFTGCPSVVKDAAQCTPLRDSLVRLGDSMPAVSEKLVCAYDYVKEKIADL